VTITSSTLSIRTHFHPANLYFACLLGSYAAVILITPRAPLLQDYPTWVYEGVVVGRALQGHPAPNFLWKHFPVPNLLSDVGLGVLCTVMPWRWAAKLWVCFYLALSYIACYRFTARLPNRSYQVYWIAPTILVLNLCFWWGFLNFQFSVALMLLFCYYLFEENARPWPIGTLLILVFLCHAICFVVCGIALLVHALANKNYKLMLPTLPSGFLVAWYIYGRFVSIGDPENLVLNDVPVPYFSRAFAGYKVNTFFKSLGYVNPKLGAASVASSLFGSDVMYILLLAVGILGFALIYLMIRSLRVSLKERAPERLVWVTVGLVFIAALCCPSRALGISDPGSRFMVCGLALAVMLLRPSGGLFKTACFLSTVLGLAGVAMFAAISFQIIPTKSGQLVPAIAAFAHVEPDLRASYYDVLETGDMDKPVFGTSLLYNRRVLPSSQAAAPAIAAASQK
jgi:hypothetical protein